MLSPLAALAVVAMAAPGGAVEGPDAFWEAPGFRRGAFLTRGLGARPIGMGGAFTAVADDASAIAWNPGGLGQVPRVQAVVAYDAVGNDLGLSAAAAAVPLGIGVAAVSVQVMDYGGFDWRDSDGFVAVGPGSVMDTAVTVGYALPNPAALGGTSGIAVEYLTEAAGGSLVGGSLGMVIPLGPGFSFGWAVQHLGQEVEGFSLPLRAQGGIAFAPGASARLAVDGGYGMAEKQMWVSAGGEYVIGSLLALRVGYRMQGEDQGLEGMTGLAAGAGFRLGKLGIDYAYQPFGDLATSHRLALLYGLGPSTKLIRDKQWERRPVGISTIQFEPEIVEMTPRVGVRRPAAGALNLAVLDLAGQNVAAGDAAVVSDMLRAALAGTAAFNVIEKQNMTQVLAGQAGCTSEDCAVRLGKLLNVQRMVVGSFGRLMDQLYVSVRVVDVETGKIVFAEAAKGRTAEAVEKGVETLAIRIAGRLGAEAPAGVPGYRVAAPSVQHYEEAVAFYGQGDYDRALDKAQAAVRADDRNWQAWQMLGNCQYAKGDRQAALGSYSRSLEVNPDNGALRAWMNQVAP